MVISTIAYFVIVLFSLLIVDKPEMNNTTYVIIYKEVKEEPKPPVKSKPVARQPKPKVSNIVKMNAKPLQKKQQTINNDTYLLAQIINAEAKGESYNGKVAVGNVIMNRVKHPDFPDTIKDVVYQRGQFSPVTDGSINNKPSDEAIQAAKDVMNGKRVVGSQALYFYNPDTSTNDWIFSRPTLMEIGNHKFAR